MRMIEWVSHPEQEKLWTPQTQEFWTSRRCWPFWIGSVSEYQGKKMLTNSSAEAAMPSSSKRCSREKSMTAATLSDSRGGCSSFVADRVRRDGISMGPHAAVAGDADLGQRGQRSPGGGGRLHRYVVGRDQRPGRVHPA